LPRENGRQRIRKPRRGLKLALLAAFGVLLASLPFFWRRGIDVEVVIVKRGPIVSSATATATGTVESERDVRVMALVPGLISEILTDEGRQVRKGDLLARLDDQEALASHRLALANLESARSGLERAEVSLRVRTDTAGTDLDRAQAVLSKAKSDHARARELHQAGVISSQSVEAAETEERLAVASFEAARSRIADRDIAAKEVAAARSAVAQMEAAARVAQVILDRTRIIAPFDGVISSRFVQPGQTISPATPLFSIVDRTDIHVRATFDEVDLGRIQLGQVARLSLDSFPGRHFEGLVDEISPTVSTTRQETRTVGVKIRFTGQIDGVRPGMSADPEIIVGTRDDALYLPTDVILEDHPGETKRRVFVLDDRTIRLRTIETGLTNWDFTEVLSGVSEGDRVVSDLDEAGLADGTKVRSFKPSDRS
ncbi:MAG TPA: efflux RND transporter periplasmic adaptor subunit, partial [Candidatus Polarisedimenticolia bacterium]|nr:efflux RND transporter periplasmic adaptor subunit [Candidatus Polarisedimenticolia bacterium]